MEDRARPARSRLAEPLLWAWDCCLPNFRVREVALVPLLLIGALGAGAQDSARSSEPILSLPRALELALSQGFSVVEARLAVEAAADRTAAARTRRLPSLSVGAAEIHHLTSESYEFTQGSLGEVAGQPVPTEDVGIPTTNDFSTLLSASAALPLLQQYEIDLEIQQREVAERLAAEDLRAHQQQLADQVKDTYYRLAKIQASLGATRESLVFLRELDGLVGRYVEEEIALEYERLEVDARLAQTGQRALIERNQLATLKQQLNALLARDVDTTFRVTPLPPRSVAELDPHSARQEALSLRPEVRRARLEIEHAELDYKLKWAEYIPKLSLEVSFLKPYDIHLLPDETATVGLYGKWEFFDWGRKRRELSARHASIAQAKQSLEQSESQIRVDVDERLRALQEARAGVEVAALSLRAAREKLRVKFAQYEQRAVLLEDVLDAESARARANSDYEQAHLNVWTAEADLERSLGSS